ncbi:unnamed protein product, partial [Prorocentrum cordatum]
VYATRYNRKEKKFLAIFQHTADTSGKNGIMILNLPILIFSEEAADETWVADIAKKFCKGKLDRDGIQQAKLKFMKEKR